MRNYKRVNPAVTVREVLEAARRAGVPFPAAWHTAINEITDKKWAEALAQTSNTWRRAYQLEPPTDRDRAIDQLSRRLTGELADLDAAMRCPVCDEVVVRDGRGAKVYCSTRCSKIAFGRREVLDVAA